MPRTPRILEDGGYYHVIARGNNQEPVFTIEGGFRSFRRLLLLSKDRFPFKLYHYCLMPNHLHLLVSPAQGKDLSKIMQILLQGYTRWYKTQEPFIGQLWQARFKNLPITDETYLFECGRYIERNPVRAHMVSSPADYAWSSYRHYAFGQTDTVVDTDPYYEAFGSNPAARQRNYREFVHIEPGTSLVHS